MNYLQLFALFACVILLWISSKADCCHQGQILFPWLRTCPY